MASLDILNANTYKCKWQSCQIQSSYDSIVVKTFEKIHHETPLYSTHYKSLHNATYAGGITVQGINLVLHEKIARRVPALPRDYPNILRCY